MSAEEPVAVSSEALLRAEQYVEEEEGAANKLKGWLGGFIRLTAFIMSVFHLYAAYAIVPTQVLGRSTSPSSCSSASWSFRWRGASAIA